MSKNDGYRAIYQIFQDLNNELGLDLNADYLADKIFKIAQEDPDHLKFRVFKILEDINRDFNYNLDCDSLTDTLSNVARYVNAEDL